MTENLLTASLDEHSPSEAASAAPRRPGSGVRPEGLPEKFWDDEKGEIRLDALIKSYTELERKFGSVAARPVPGRPEDYQISLQNDFLNADPDVNRLLHGAGFTQEQAQLVYDIACERLMPMVAEIAALFEAQSQIDRLQDEFGGEQRWREIARQLDAWGRKHLPQQIYDALSTTHEGVIAMHRMMTGDEPELRGAGHGAETPFNDAALKQLMRDPRYWRDQDPVVVDRVREGFRRLYKDSGGM
jgi:hypothetical protein